jgi:MFS transporter, DHA1 family, multidrug resistance protein
MTRTGYVRLIVILGSLAALAPFSIDMYLPGFPAIALDLHTDVASVGLSLSSFFIGISMGQLLYGPLYDRFGRKIPLFLGLFLYIIASVACAGAMSVNSLIGFRFVQAIGACAASVASVAMVRDLFPVSENAKVFSLLMLVIALSPLVAPTVGGYVTAAFHWQPVFRILAAMTGLMIIAVYFGLPETKPGNPAFSLRPGFILSNFGMVMREPQFYTYTLCGSFSFAALLTYVSGSPLLFMEVFAVDAKVYGWIFAFLSVGLIGASQLNTVMLRRYTSAQMIRWALIAEAAIGILFFAATALHLLDLYSTIAFIFLFLGCVGIVLPNTSAMAMAPFSETAGSASSLMGATQMGIGSLSTATLSAITDQTPLPMALVMTTAACLAAISLFAGLSRMRSM